MKKRHFREERIDDPIWKKVNNNEIFLEKTIMFIYAKETLRRGHLHSLNFVGLVYISLIQSVQEEFFSSLNYIKTKVQKHARRREYRRFSTEGDRQ